MRIPSFEIRNQRSLAYAACPNLPSLMAITGPNGAGKSTLLYAIRNIGGRNNVLYVGPHRSSRRQNVQQRHLISRTLVFEEMLARDDAPGFDGVALVSGARDPWSNDDSANYIKHSLCQIEVERQQAISARFDRDGQIAQGSLADPWMPLRELSHNLLPHLAFARIDNANRDAIRCLWNVHQKNVEVDYDDLSSGEKSIIQMFYPLVEHRVRALLEEIRTGAQAADRPPICILIDEPELHLHPNLQIKVLDYLRLLTTNTNTQVIMVTHSPTIVEHAAFDELFLLRPVELVEQGENQLVQIATDEERLHVLRQLFGTTSNITAMQSLVVVEGAYETAASNVVTDRKLYRALHPGFDSVLVVPGGGKAECMKLVAALNTAFPQLSQRLQAVALLDKDLGDTKSTAQTRLLPVSMIENFILDPLPIWEAIQAVSEKTPFKTIDEVEHALDKVLDSLVSAEIERRAKASLGYATFRPQSPLEALNQQAAEFIGRVTQQFSPEKVAAAIAQGRAAVEALQVSKQRREHFHGKEAVNEFYAQYLHTTGLKKEIFKFLAAKKARDRKAVTAFFDSFFAELQQVEKK